MEKTTARTNDFFFMSEVYPVEAPLETIPRECVSLVHALKVGIESGMNGKAGSGSGLFPGLYSRQTGESQILAGLEFSNVDDLARVI
jgi:hypothetical protein